MVYEPAVNLAKTLLAAPISTDPIERSRSAIAASVLIERDLPTYWPVVWKAIEEDTKFGHQLAERMANRSRGENIPIALIVQVGPMATAQLYTWLQQNYPQNEDPVHEGVHGVGTREAIGHFRDSTLHVLRSSDHADAATAMEWVQSQLPDIPYLHDLALDVKRQVRAALWQPPTPEHLALLQELRERRFVQSDDDLLDVVVQAIERFDTYITAHRMHWVMWNEDHANGHGIPKSEVQLSQLLEFYLKQELTKKRGIVVNRECDVSFRRFVDIRATQIIPNEGEYDTREVGIEVKGCWHDELWSAMETQLRDKYLSKGVREHGIYVMFWFLCDSWIKSSAKSQALRNANGRDREACRNALCDQAGTLSSGWPNIKSAVVNASLENGWFSTNSSKSRQSRDQIKRADEEKP